MSPVCKEQSDTVETVMSFSCLGVNYGLEKPSCSIDLHEQRILQVTCSFHCHSGIHGEKQRGCEHSVFPAQPGRPGRIWETEGHPYRGTEVKGESCSICGIFLLSGAVSCSTHQIHSLLFPPLSGSRKHQSLTKLPGPSNHSTCWCGQWQTETRLLPGFQAHLSATGNIYVLWILSATWDVEKNTSLGFFTIKS